MHHSRRSALERACGVGAGLGIEDDLGDALAIAQVDEDAAAVIAAVLNPAEEHDRLPTSPARRSPQS